MNSKIVLENFPSPSDRYLVEDCLDKGAFGKIVIATDTQSGNKKVAIKMQKLSETIKPCILQEYKILRNLDSHFNLVEFYGIFRYEDTVWFIMELCHYGSVLKLVKSLLVQNKRMSEEHIAYILKEAVKAVIFLHEKCIIHRDIKAKNIVLTKDGEIKIADFGFSALLTDSTDRRKDCLGSPCWMAPEIISCRRTKKEYDNRVDVWSLGVTAIELGDGEPPYYTMNPSRILFQVEANPPQNLYRIHNWSENYVDFINECLEKVPEQRPYAVELLEHPFLSEVPDNNYYLSLEIKVLLENSALVNLPPEKPETAMIENYVKNGFDGEMKPILLEDLACLTSISEHNILKTLSARMKSEQFYTFIGDVLLSLNPNQKKGVFGEEYHEKYRFKSRSENAPHIYAVADSAYQYALHHQIPQKIILSGESGSGKTRNYLHAVNHLLYLGQNKCVNINRIKGAIKLIHSLTHASTPNSNHSTRCILKTDLKFGSTGKVTAAAFNVYQLEKWRVSSVDMFQGNYHFLYYIYDGLIKNNKHEQFHLNADRGYRYLRIDDNSDDKNPKLNIDKNIGKFKKILKIFEEFEISEEAMSTIFSTVAAILNIGEIRFSPDESVAVITNEEIIEKISQLLSIDPVKVKWSLTNYCIVRKGTAFKKRTKADEARDARDVFANNLYSRLVDYLVAIINHKLEVGGRIFGDRYSVQILDYFGFECLKVNHLPQLLINCFNEQLHYHYLQRLFSWEYLDVNQEEIEYQPFEYYDNKLVLDELLSKSEGFFSVVDEASIGGHNGRYIMDYLHKNDTEFVNVVKPLEFSVSHYTGKVTYSVVELSYKNRDFLPSDLIETLRLSDNPIIKMFFTNKLNKFGNLIVNFDEDKQKYKFPKEASKNQFSQIRRIRTAIQTFKALTLEILKDLSVGGSSGGTHFVRCVRTNLSNEVNSFDQKIVKQQIRALAVAETAKARQNGYPHRLPFQEFLRRYQFLAFDFNENVDLTKDNCRLLLLRLKMEGWCIGKSKVFLKYYAEEYLARLYETHVKKIIKIQSILRRFLANCRLNQHEENKPKIQIFTIEEEKKHEMTEEEAAVIIQKAYKESTMKKSFEEFATDYQILNEETCNFIRKFADIWRKKTMFYVLCLYRAKAFDDTFNISLQVHLYNANVFFALTEHNAEVSSESIDSKAQVSNWLKEPKLPLRKIPFRLDELPFYDTSDMCTSLVNSSACIESNESWDSPYRWREQETPKYTQIEDFTRKSEDLIDEPYVRDSEILNETEKEEECESKTEEIKIVIEDFSNKTEEKVEKKADKLKDQKKIATPKSPIKEQENNNANTKSANKDFDYIRPSTSQRGKPVDPIAELRRITPKNSSEDEAPFNFRGMLRKTNFNREEDKEIVKEEKPMFSLKKTNFKLDDKKSEADEKPVYSLRKKEETPKTQSDIKNSEECSSTSLTTEVKEPTENLETFTETEEKGEDIAGPSTSRAEKSEDFAVPSTSKEERAIIDFFTKKEETEAATVTEIEEPEERNIVTIEMIEEEGEEVDASITLKDEDEISSSSSDYDDDPEFPKKYVRFEIAPGVEIRGYEFCI